MILDRAAAHCAILLMGMLQEFFTNHYFSKWLAFQISGCHHLIFTFEGFLRICTEITFTH